MATNRSQYESHFYDPVQGMAHSNTMLEIDNQDARANLLFCLAKHYIEQGRWIDSWRLLEEVLAIRRQGDDLNAHADTIYQLARTHHLLKNLDTARLHYRDALRLYEHIENRRGSAACRSALGRLMIQQGFFEDGLDELEEAQRIYRTLGQEQQSGEVSEVVQLVSLIKERQQV